MPTRSEQRRINIQQGRPVNEGLEDRKTCNDCIHFDACSSGGGLFNEKDKNKEMLCGHFKDKSRYIELPCALGDVVYFYKAELEEICPAKVIKIEENYYTPSMPFWLTIEYESKLIGKQKVKIAECVFKLVCHKTKEEAEQVLKGGVKE